MAIVLEGDGTITGVTTFTTPLDDIKFDSINVTGIATASTFQAGTGVSMASPRSQNIALFTNNVEGLTLDDAGRLGIGISIPNQAADANNVKVVNAGIITANQYYGNQLTAVGSRVTGVGTFENGLNITGNITNGLNVSAGIVTFSDDVVFTGAAANVTWDKSTDDLIFNDNAQAKFGTGGDLSIYHDSSFSRIKDTGTNALIIQSGEIRLQNEAADETMGIFISDGASQLYHNNIKTFETAENGIKVVAPENNHARIHMWADDGDDGPDKWEIMATTQGHLKFYHGASSENTIVLNGDGPVQLYHDNTLRLATTTSGITISNELNVAGISTLTGNVFMPDNAELRLGDSGDLQLFHHSASGQGRIYNSNAAGINIISDITTLSNNANNETLLKATNGAAVELYDNNVKKLETQSYGIQLHDATAPEIRLLRTGNSGYAKIYADAANKLYLSADHSSAGADSKVTIMVDGIERASWDSEYYVKNGSIVFQTADKGICLGSTTLNADNTLTDYEEGTFTPTLGTSSGSAAFRDNNNTLSYTKIGNTVHITGQIVVGTCSSPSGAMWLIGLPFTSGDGTELSKRGLAVGLGWFNGSGISGSEQRLWVSWIAENSANFNNIRVLHDSEIPDTTSADLIADGTDLWFDFTYKT